MSDTTKDTGPAPGTELIQPDGFDLRRFYTDPVEVLNKALSDIEKRCISETFDMNEKAGRDACRSLAAKIPRSKTAIDDAGKAITEDWRKKTEAVNLRRKEAREFLDDLHKRVRKPLTDWERAEEDRISAHTAVIEGIRTMADLRVGAGIEALEDMIERLKNLDTTEMEEFEETADELRKDAIRDLETSLDAKIEAAKEREKVEAERKELEALRAKNAELEAAAAAQSEPQSAEEPAPAPTAPAGGGPTPTGDVLIVEAVEDLARLVGDRDLAAKVLQAIIDGKVRHVRFG